MPAAPLAIQGQGDRRGQPVGVEGDALDGEGIVGGVLQMQGDAAEDQLRHPNSGGGGFHLALIRPDGRREFPIAMPLRILVEQNVGAVDQHPADPHLAPQQRQQADLRLDMIQPHHVGARVARAAGQRHAIGAQGRMQRQFQLHRTGERQVASSRLLGPGDGLGAVMLGVDRLDHAHERHRQHHGENQGDAEGGPGVVRLHCAWTNRPASTPASRG